MENASVLHTGQIPRFSWSLSGVMQETADMDDERPLPIHWSQQVVSRPQCSPRMGNFEVHRPVCISHQRESEKMCLLFPSFPDNA